MDLRSSHSNHMLTTGEMNYWSYLEQYENPVDEYPSYCLEQDNSGMGAMYYGAEDSVEVPRHWVIA